MRKKIFFSSANSQDWREREGWRCKWETRVPRRETDELSIEHASQGISLAIQGLRLCRPMQGACVQSLVRELRSHMLWGTAKKKKNIQAKLPALAGRGLVLCGGY